MLRFYHSEEVDGLGGFVLARIEVGLRPDFEDSVSKRLLRRIELFDFNLRKKIRWARLLEVYWLDIAVPREELIPAITEICWDKVLQWVFTGNLMPSAAGKSGGLQDLMQESPFRPGKFWGIERRFRAGVTDNVGRALIEAFEIVLGRSLSQARASSGGLWLVEGPDLNEDGLAIIAREIFCNELVETWTLVPEELLKKNDRFHQERIKYDLPKIPRQGSESIEIFELKNLEASALEDLSQKKYWGLSFIEMKAIQEYFSEPSEQEIRKSKGLLEPTDVEMEIFSQTWSEHYQHKIFNSKIHYQEKDSDLIPRQIENLFQSTIRATAIEVGRSWLLSDSHENSGIYSFDEEDAFCIKVETHNFPSALDPYGGALTGIGAVNRDILGCGLGAKPIFNFDVFCLASSDYAKPLPDRILHPRRILDGVRRGIEHGGNKTGVPTINGALVFDDHYLGRPLIYCGTGGFMPRRSGERSCEFKQVLSGDRICMVGGRIGKDGIHQSTLSSFSSLALDASSSLPAVQLDSLTQKRVMDFLLEARDQGLYRAVTNNGAGGLSLSVGQMARLSGGAILDVGLAMTKYPGLKPFELVVSESQERMALAVPPEQMPQFLLLAEKRGVEVSDLGEFTQSGRLEMNYSKQRVADLDLKFLYEGLPQLELTAFWEGRPSAPEQGLGSAQACLDSLIGQGGDILLHLLGQPNIASKEWLIRQYDHEVQGMSVIKPLHTVISGTLTALSGPNDAGVVKPKVISDRGLAVGCGIQPKLSEIDPFLMAQASVDEALRNILCVGAEYGTSDCITALVSSFCWPDPLRSPQKMASLVRACYGLREAALALSIPLVSGKDSMKNDFQGKCEGRPVTLSILPTLLMTAVGRVSDIKLCRTADFKAVGDCIYLLGGSQFGLWGSELMFMLNQKGDIKPTIQDERGFRTGEPSWTLARKVYSWIGGAVGKLQIRLKSLHDISEGGLLVAVAESLIARGFGAALHISVGVNGWEFLFGEGFHSFVATVSEEFSKSIELEWGELGVPFQRLGIVQSPPYLEVSLVDPESSTNLKSLFKVDVKRIRSAWSKEGYWE